MTDDFIQITLPMMVTVMATAWCRKRRLEKAIDRMRADMLRGTERFTRGGNEVDTVFSGIPAVPNPEES